MRDHRQLSGWLPSRSRAFGLGLGLGLLLWLGSAAKLDGTPTSLEWSTDGRYVVAASDRGRAIRVSTRGLSSKIPADKIESVHLSPEGRLALSVVDGTFVSVDLQTREIVEVPVDERFGEPVSWHRGPHGDVVVTQTVGHYNIRRSGGKNSDSDAAPTRNFRDLWLDPIEPLAYVDTGFGLEVRHLKSGLTLRAFDAGTPEQRYLGAVRDPHGRLILGLEDAQGFRLWTPPDLPEDPWDLPPGSCKSLSGDGLLLAVGSKDAFALYATATREKIDTVKMRVPVAQVAFSPNGRHVAAALANGLVRVWEVSSTGLPLPLERELSEVDTGRIRPDSISRGDLPRREPTASWRLSGATVHLSWTTGPQTGDLLSGWVGGRLALIDPSNGDEFDIPLTGIDLGRPYAMSPDGTQLAAVIEGGVGIFETRRWRLARKLPSGGLHNQLQWRGTVLATDAGSGRAQTWSPSDGKPISDAFVVAAEATARFQLSPDGQWLAITGRTPRVVRANDGVQVAKLDAQWSGVIAATWSPDGRRLATAGGDATVLIWDTASWKPISLVEGLSGREMAFSPDGAKLVSASWDGAVIANVSDGVLEQQLAFEGLLSSVDWSRAGIAMVDSTGSLYLWPP